MANIICVFNEKGGCGKTATSVSLCGALAREYEEKDGSDKRILIIDADPNGGASQEFGADEEGRLPKHSYAEMIIDYCDEGVEPDVRDAVVQTSIPYVDIMPSNNKLHSAVKALDRQEFNRDMIISQLFANLDNYYDWIIIDTMGAKHTALTTNFLFYSHYVLLPTEPEDKNFKGYAESMQIIKAINRARGGDKPHVLGMFYTKIDLTKGQTVAEKEYLEEGPSLFGDDYIDAPIPFMKGTVQNASRRKMPVEYCSRHSKVASAYRKLLKEIEKRIAEHKQEKSEVR